MLSGLDLLTMLSIFALLSLGIKFGYIRKSVVIVRAKSVVLWHTLNPNRFTKSA